MFNENFYLLSTGWIQVKHFPPSCLACAYHRLMVHSRRRMRRGIGVYGQIGIPT